jgi:outer membrane protein TolC
VLSFYKIELFMVCTQKHILGLCLFLLLGIGNINIKAQTVSADILLTKALESDDFLPLLIEAAIKYSPQVKRSANSVDVATSNLHISKNAIFSGLGVNSSYNYGTNYSAVNNPGGVGSATNTFTTSQSGFYNLGVVVQLPLISILNRKHLLKAGQAQINMAKADQESVNMAIKEDVIRQYQELKLAKKILELSNNSLQTAQSNAIMAEKQFLQNQIAIDQASGVQQAYNKAKIEYETSLNSFQTIFMQLEAYIGVNLTTLLQKIK